MRLCSGFSTLPLPKRMLLMKSLEVYRYWAILMLTLIVRCLYSRDAYVQCLSFHASDEVQLCEVYTVMTVYARHVSALVYMSCS